jgi:hypothetical protein
VWSDQTLSLDEIRDWQFHVWKTPRGQIWRGYPGMNGSNIVYDLSGKGNHGLITNATLSNFYLPRVL